MNTLNEGGDVLTVKNIRTSTLNKGGDTGCACTFWASVHAPNLCKVWELGKFLTLNLKIRKLLLKDPERVRSQE